MADSSEDKILINVGLNADEAEQGITALGQKIDSISKKDLGTTNVQSYKIQIRELTAELQKIEQQSGRNSAAFRQGGAELGRLKEAARDFKTQIEAYDPSNKLAGVANIAKGAAVGLTGAAGAMALFGIKGEKAEEVMLRLQGILALSHAISSIHEVTQGYQSFINVLGLASTAASKVNNVKISAPGVSSVGDTSASAVDTSAISAQQTAQEELAAAQVAADEATAEAETALNAVKAEGLDATVALTGAEQAYLETAAAKATALATLTAAQTAYDEALIAGTAASTANSEASAVQVVSTEAVAAAEVGATGAAIGLKVALWAIGIGLITTAIAYLISNWDKVKTSIENLFPALKTAGDSFKTVENSLLGVGNAVLHFLKSPIDEAVTAVKILIDIMKGDFKAASKDFQDGLKQQMADWNVLANFKSGQADGEAKDAEAANKVRVQAEIEANERIIKERKALGENVFALEIKNQQLKNSILDKDADDYKKKLADGESEITVLQNQEIKKRNDAAEKLRKEAAEKAAALKKADLDKLKSGDDEAAKVINEGQKSQRDIELADADFKYNKLIALANKYGQDASKLEEALGLTKLRINKKYSDETTAYLEKVEEESLSDFDKKRKQILLEAQAAMKDKSFEDSLKIFASSLYQTQTVDKEEELSNNKDDADTNVTNTETANRAGADGKDSAQTTYNKEEAIRKAKLLALKAQYLQEQFLAKDNATKLASINANYNKAAKESDDDGTKARIALAEAEKDAKIATYQTVSDALSAAADLAGKNTVAGKALAVASATISTYLSAQKAYESMAAIPIIGPELGIVAAAAAVATGLASVKSILSVKVPGSSSSAGVTPSYQAPTINSTTLNQAQQGVQNVNVLNQPDTKAQQPIKAYVVEKDITSAQDRASYLNRRSTI